MFNDVHVHEDDLELYRAGHLEPQYMAAVETHLSGCQDCRERLDKCLGPEVAATEEL
jgi:hypothetical protein